ncbi:CPBP family intramembrane glutamic endopeptidase [Olleya sp. Bg11-27]|uniref:CPBP family intramembrane glutamic endopeptidase n=1 Tax=Olleya sp. Bg11-27 TaxID=2058135 RepID=UPI000C3091A4|nr:CPBP family intramembrane glutamic endopeptidase [Olleya sp. Bg11-27]AUC76273.1 CPBP family intramembrane metalloprotease [Olleya sp. Bg11-27]
MIKLFESIFAYVKNPRPKHLKYATFEQKFGIVLQCVPLCLVLGLGFGVLIAVLEAVGVYSSDTHAMNKLFEEKAGIYIIFTAVIVAPIIEELIFRGPITLFNKKHFKIAFYSFTILFGYVHILNFEITPKILLLSPLLVAPQIVVGFIFGYIRVRLGLVYSMLLHASYNGVIIIPSVLLMS